MQEAYRFPILLSHSIHMNEKLKRIIKLKNLVQNIQTQNRNTKEWTRLLLSCSVYCLVIVIDQIVFFF